MRQEVWPSYKPQVAQIFSMTKRSQDHRLPGATERRMGSSPLNFASPKLPNPAGIKYPLNVIWAEAGRWLYLTPQGLLTHRQCLGDCATHLFGGGRQVGKAEPRPVGNEMLFAVTHPCAALGGRGSSFSEWVSLCYFLFTGFSRCLFPPGGQWVWKPKCSHFVAGTFFFFLSWWRLEVWCLWEKLENKEGERGKENLFWAGMDHAQSILLFYI